MYLLAKYKFGALAMVTGLFVAVTLSLTYGENFQAAAINMSSPEVIMEQANVSIEKFSADFTAKFEAATTQSDKDALLKKTASGLQKYCRYFKLAKKKGFNCGKLVTKTISSVNRKINDEEEDVAALIYRAVEKLKAQFTKTKNK